MCTLLLAWINAKYKHDYFGLFFATFLIDIGMFNAIVEIVKCWKVDI